MKYLHIFILAFFFLGINSCTKDRSVNPIIEFRYNLKPSLSFQEADIEVSLVSASQLIDRKSLSRQIDAVPVNYVNSNLSEPQSIKLGASQIQPSKIEGISIETFSIKLLNNQSEEIKLNLGSPISGFTSQFDFIQLDLDLDFDKTYVVTLLCDMDKSIAFGSDPRMIVFQPRYEVVIEEN